MPTLTIEGFDPSAFNYVLFINGDVTGTARSGNDFADPVPGTNLTMLSGVVQEFTDEFQITGDVVYFRIEGFTDFSDRTVQPPRILWDGQDISDNPQQIVTEYQPPQNGDETTNGGGSGDSGGIDKKTLGAVGLLAAVYLNR